MLNGCKYKDSSDLYNTNKFLRAIKIDKRLGLGCLVKFNIFT